MYQLDLITGERTMVAKNPGDVVGWGTEDESFEVRVAVTRNSTDSSETYRIRDTESSEWRNLITFPYGEEGYFVNFCLPQDSCAYMLSTVGRETKALIKIDLQTGNILSVISSNNKSDIQGVDIDDDTKQIRAVSYNYARVENVFFDDELQQEYHALETLKPTNSEIQVSSTTDDKSIWVVR